MLPESFALVANGFRAAILVHHFFKIFYFLLPVIKLLVCSLKALLSLPMAFVLQYLSTISSRSFIFYCQSSSFCLSSLFSF